MLHLIRNLVKRTIFLVNKPLNIRFTTLYTRSFSLFILILILGLKSYPLISQDTKEGAVSDIADQNLQIEEYLFKAWNFLNTNIDSMYFYDRLALELSKRTGNMQGLAQSHSQIANYYEITGDYDSAVFHHYEGIKIYESVDSLRRGLINAYYNLSNTFSTFDFIKQAKKSLEKSLEIAKEFQDFEHLAWVYFEFGQSISLKKPDSSIFFYKEGLKILDTFDFSKNERPGLMELKLAIYANIGFNYLELNSVDSTKKFIQHFDELAETFEFNKVFNEMNSAKLNSKYYLKINDYKNAIGPIRKVFNLSAKLKNQEERLNSLEFLAEYHEKTKNYDSSLFYFRLAQALNDSLSGGEVKSKMAEIETAHRTAEKEKKIIQLESQSKLAKSRNLLLTGLSIAFALIIIIVSLFYFQNRKKSRKLANQNTIIQESYEEIENLIRESHHRIKNNLQVVSSLLKMQSKSVHSDEAKSSLMEAFNRVKTIALLHQRLQGSQSFKNIKVKDFIEQLTGNIKHSLTTDESDIELKTQLLDMEIETDDTISIGLIINELITNSIKYGFPDKKGKIEVKLYNLGPELVLEVKDNGIGFPENFDPLSGKSLGFKIVKSLATKLKAQLEVRNENGAIIQIKMKSKESTR